MAALLGSRIYATFTESEVASAARYIPRAEYLMLKVYNCIATEHDLKLVALAAFVCILASVAAIRLLRYARHSKGRMRRIWLTVSAISTGFGIWATHFIAMLAFTPGLPSGYNIVLTVASLVAAISLTGVGLTVSLMNWRHGPWIGGAIVAGGIAAMHYTGMAAFEVAGTVMWDPVLVAASILLGAAVGAIALPVGLHGDSERWKIGGALLLTLAICAHHFTAMGAASILPDPSIAVSQAALPAEWLAFGVAIASLAILGLAAGNVAPPIATAYGYLVVKVASRNIQDFTPDVQRVLSGGQGQFVHEGLDREDVQERPEPTQCR